MSLTDKVRAFIAVDLAPEVRAAVARLKSELARVRSDVRWVRDEGLHATLKFLGWVPADRLERVRDAVTHAVAPWPAFTTRVRGLGAFPSLARPRVLWVGMEAPELGGLARAVEEAVEPLGFPVEKRTFHPHVTLGRVGGRRGWRSLEERIQAHGGDDFGASPTDHLSFYRSDLRPGGAVYNILWTIGLSDSRKGDIHGLG